MGETIRLPHEHDMNSAEVIKHMPSGEDLQTVASLMKLLGDPSRLRIFWILCHVEECVTNIGIMAVMSSPAVSHHLRVLRDGGLIVSRRSGKEMYYRAADTPLAQKLHHAMEEIMDISCPREK